MNHAEQFMSLYQRLEKISQLRRRQLFARLSPKFLGLKVNMYQVLLTLYYHVTRK